MDRGRTVGRALPRDRLAAAGYANRVCGPLCARLAHSPTMSAAASTSTRCDGTTPKFECELPDGEVVKVKYTGAEPHGEVAASRLLGALGFGADRVFFARRLRCYGCPRYPFPTLKLVTLAGADKAFARGLDYDNAIDFEWVSVERKTEGEFIETAAGRGWAWHELAARADGVARCTPTRSG